MFGVCVDISARTPNIVMFGVRVDFLVRIPNFVMFGGGGQVDSVASPQALSRVFVCFFLSFRRPKPITGLSGWPAPDQPLRTQELVPYRRTGALPSLWQTQSDPLLVGKTDHNVGRLACIFGLTNPHNQRDNVVY